jgi:G3E family GTPase
MNDVGISSFTYKAAKPFHMIRLLKVLNTWPVPKKDELDLVDISPKLGGVKTMNGEPLDNPFVSVVRSKGFCWMAPSSFASSGGDQWRHETAMYWSHAGKHFGITAAGKWWDSLEDKSQIKEMFDERPGEYERMMAEDWVSEEFGDRRQEVVFIGVDFDEAKIRKALDDCLLTDEELVKYRKDLSDYRKTIVNSDDCASLFSGAGHVN